MNSAVLRRPACQACQRSILQSFAAIAGVALPPSSRPSFHSQNARLQQRFHTQSQVKAQEQPWNQPSIPQAETLLEDASKDGENDTPNPPASIPWYLQVDTPSPPSPSHPLAERQMLPPLPPSPPTILSPILQYLSVDSGLDNLSLIDLRHLDPPPALGANLIMIIGTARSVKHLNVSADRFCRWLRSNYKMRPYADGLLGRNELKLKLRRKARRLKLAQSVGNSIEETKDDGITTGWVCVNLGSVEGIGEAESMAESERVDLKEIDTEALQESAAAEDEATAEEEEEEEEEEEDMNDGYSGFGSRSMAPRIVVQMFTEEKRLELDLEGLWGVRTARRAAKEEKAAYQAEKNDGESTPLTMQRRQIEFEKAEERSREEVYGLKTKPPPSEMFRYGG